MLETWKVVLQETVEPLLEEYKPPGLIKRIYFKNLTFGDLPFVVENVWVENEGENHVLMEVHTTCIHAVSDSDTYMISTAGQLLGLLLFSVSSGVKQLCVTLVR
jgi:hypothetical protein